MLVKAYFDGGNQPDSTQYDTVTLATIVGRMTELKPFERDWKAVLKKHNAPYLHTTDAMTFNNDFARSNGWNETRRDAFLEDCAKLFVDSIIKLVDPKEPVAIALAPYTMTIVLKDFKRVQTEFPRGLQDATEALAIHSVAHALDCCDKFKAHFLQLYFDQNEPFMGHIKDRLRNRKFRRDSRDKDEFDPDRIVHIGEADMRRVPALQAADLLAYCVGHSTDVRFSWQKAVLDRHRFKEWFDYSVLSQIDQDHYDRISLRFKFPRRKPTR